MGVLNMYRQETAVVFSDGAIEIEFKKKKNGNIAWPCATWKSLAMAKLIWLHVKFLIFFFLNLSLNFVIHSDALLNHLPLGHMTFLFVEEFLFTAPASLIGWRIEKRTWQATF